MKEELAKIVGAENVSDNLKTLEMYSQDGSFVRSCKPDLVVKPVKTEEVQEIIRAANKNNMPIVPYSSGLNLHGATIPDQGGIILDLSRMNQIEQIDDKNWFAVVQAGVTYEQLQDEVEKHDLRVMIPWGTPPKRSVLSSYMEREPTVAFAHHQLGNALLMDTEVVLPDAQIFRTGSWSTEIPRPKPGGPQGPIGFMGENYRLWSCAQGTLGVVTRVVVKLRYLSKQRKILFVPFDKLEDMVRFLPAALRLQVGTEWLALNKFNLAALFTNEWKVPDGFPSQKIPSESFLELRRKLPMWALAICLEGLTYLPNERIKYQENALRDECVRAGVKLCATVNDLVDMEGVFLRETIRPWGALKKFCYKGSVHDVNFYAPMRDVPKFVSVLNEVATDYGYPTDDIGGYFLPWEWGRGCYCEFDFHNDAANPDETGRVKRLLFEANETLAANGAVPAKLYGDVADITYKRITPSWVESLRGTKKTLDENNIMNPGKLCFKF